MNNSKNEEKSTDKENNQIELKQDNNIQTNIQISEENYKPSIIPQPEKLEPLLIKILNESNSNNDITILDYLQLKELIQLSVLNHSIKSIIEKYYPLRLKFEYNKIKNFESKNNSLKNTFLKKYFSLFPYSKNTWFKYDINDTIKTISNLNRHTISQLKGIKKIPKLDEKIYAPFCLIFNYNSKNEKVINNGWKKTADFIMSDMRFFIRFSNLIIENMDNKNISQAFIYINEIENYIEKIKRFSPYLYELNIWCKAVIIYYYLIHPYKLTDTIKNSLIKDNQEVYNYVLNIDDMINKFYIFKGFLEDKKIIKTKLGEYIFNFEYDIKDNKNIINNEKEIVKLIREDNKIMGNILSYLNIKDAIKFIHYNKSIYLSFQESLNISCYNILKKIFMLKYNAFNDLYSLIPTIFDNNIFSNYFFMLEDIVYPEKNNISILTKDNITYIKNYKGDNELINSICKIFCILFNIKVEKMHNDDNVLINLYIKSVILCCIKEKSITKLIKYFNIFNLNIEQIKAFYEELSNLYSIDKIKKVKNINKGFYQLLIWELYVYEYIKQFNPFLLMDKETILSKNNILLNENQNIIINDYILYLNKLKQILKIKYHFKNLFFNSKNSKKFSKIIQILIKDVKNTKTYDEKIDYIINNNNLNQTYITNAYFKSKEDIINKNRNNLPILFQKIMEELILTNLEKAEGSKSAEKSFKKDENYYLNYFTSKKNLKYNNHILQNHKSNQNEFKLLSVRNSNKISNIKNNSRYNFNININSQRNQLAFSYKEFSSDKIRNKIILKSNNLSNSYNNHLNITKTKDILDNIYITKILFYLPITDFAKLSLVNKRYYDLIKTHIYIRLFFLEKKKNLLEKKYSKIILSIDEKRNKYYIKNNISPPNLQHACELLSSLFKKDIIELRLLYQNYNPKYELIISVLCIFLNIKPNIYINKNGKKIYDFYTPGKKLLFNKDVVNIIKRLDLDDINYNIFTQIEKIMEYDIFSCDKVINYPNCLINLIKFEFGIIEYFKAIRKYSLNHFDNDILSEKEIKFCQKMNETLKIYYKIKNYVFNKCQKFRSNAVGLLKNINLEQDLGNEIKNIDYVEENIINN